MSDNGVMRMVNLIISFTLLLSLPSYAHLDDCHESNNIEREPLSSFFHTEEAEPKSSESEDTNCEMPCCHISLKTADRFEPLFYINCSHNKLDISYTNLELRRIIKEHFRPPILS